MKMRELRSILVTGGCGFIGSNFIRLLLNDGAFTGTVVNADKLTYAGNPLNLSGIDEVYPGRYTFYRADICDHEAMTGIFEKHRIDTVVHFAAESHVDRSIFGPHEFVRTNINGTFTLIETARRCWEGKDGVLFHHVSTDEVYGSAAEGEEFSETTGYDPHSPYSASKAASDHLVRAYGHTYGLPVTISNCSNNYGPYQFPEKLIPLMILNMVEGKRLPVYGDGKNVRDWLFVDDHAEAIRLILRKGAAGETYNIGGGSVVSNIDLVRLLCERTALKTGEKRGVYEGLIQFVTDRPGHDRRYAVNSEKIKTSLGWTPTVSLEQGLDGTISWYLDNVDWVRGVQTGEYRSWIEKNYGGDRSIFRG